MFVCSAPSLIRLAPLIKHIYPSWLWAGKCVCSSSQSTKKKTIALTLICTGFRRGMVPSFRRSQFQSCAEDSNYSAEQGSSCATAPAEVWMLYLRPLILIFLPLWALSSACHQAGLPRTASASPPRTEEGEEQTGSCCAPAVKIFLISCWQPWDSYLLPLCWAGSQFVWLRGPAYCRKTGIVMILFKCS